MEHEQGYQSLYRRYRPQRFADVRGQDHVTTALRNAVRDGKVAHAYLLSGPRGTGKTSTARILAKALNCTNPADGEPCDECESCVSVREGTSFDVHELDAASNTGIDAVRDLIEKAALASPGRRKVYIVDEVHQLTKAASSALLKTLEEPPDHVVFVLATTDPQKVFPTIRSRTQHYDFHLLPTATLTSLVHDINADAGLGLTGDDLDAVIRRGAGSARDALSVLDQAAAGGGLDDDSPVVVELTEALCERDAGRALAAVASACNAGRDPQQVAVDLVAHLRNGFLCIMDSTDLVALPAEACAQVEDQAKRLGRAALVRALELLGTTLVEMREALDTRVALEVALVRMTTAEADTSMAAIVERLERLERGGYAPPAASAPGAQVSDVAPAPAPTTTVPAPPPPAGRPPPSSAARERLREVNARPARGTPPPAPPASTPSSTPAPASRERPPAGPTAAGGPPPTREQLTLAWGDHVLDTLRPRPKAIYKTGRFASTDGDVAVFAFPNEFSVTQAEPHRADVEAALSAHLSARVRLRLVVDDAAPAASPPADDDDGVDPAQLATAPAAAASPTERLLQAFPGAEEMDHG